jgi:hypothetical protein
MRRYLAILAVLAVAVLPTNAMALDFTPTGAVLTVTYTEPTTNTDGSALNDLARTNVSFRVCPATGACSAPFTIGPNVAASAIAGGGNISTTVAVAVTPGQEVNVEVFVTASDLSGNVSPESVHVTKRVDRLSPAAPR